MPGIPPASQVLLVVLACWMAGTIAFGALTRIGGEVQAGHFKVVWVTGAVMAGVLAVWRPWAWIVFALCIALWWLPMLAWVASAAAAAMLALVSVSMPGASWLTVFAIACAGLLGAVTNAMLLGHWHLNQPRLGTGPLARLVRALWICLGAYTVVCVVLVATSPAGAAKIGGVTAIAFTIFSGVLNAMVAHLVKTKSIMSATGVLYLAVLLCIVSGFTGVLGALA